MARVLIVSGPSGVGKGTVIARLLDRRSQLRLAVSATTRAPRPGERDGEHYHFLTEAQFQGAEWAGELLESVRYAGHRYGTLRSELTGAQDTVVECEVDGAAALKAQLRDAVSVFLLAPSPRVLAERLAGRGTETAGQVARRLDRAREELTHAGAYDRRVVCDDVERTVDRLAALLDDQAASGTAANR